MIKIAEYLKQAIIIARLPNFNKESDMFVFLIDKLEQNKSLASKIYNKAWKTIADGKPNFAKTVIESDAQAFINKIWKQYREYALKKDRFMFVDDPNFKLMSGKILAHGIINELVENPTHYIKFVSSQIEKEIENFSIERGKNKFKTILENKH